MHVLGLPLRTTGFVGMMARQWDVSPQVTHQRTGPRTPYRRSRVRRGVVNASACRSAPNPPRGRQQRNRVGRDQPVCRALREYYARLAGLRDMRAGCFSRPRYPRERPQHACLEQGRDLG